MLRYPFLFFSYHLFDLFHFRQFIIWFTIITLAAWAQFYIFFIIVFEWLSMLLNNLLRYIVREYWNVFVITTNRSVRTQYFTWFRRTFFYQYLCFFLKLFFRNIRVLWTFLITFKVRRFDDGQMKKIFGTHWHWLILIL